MVHNLYWSTWTHGSSWQRKIYSQDIFQIKNLSKIVIYASPLEKKLSENKGFFRIPYMYIYSRTWTVWGQSVYTPHCSIFFSPPLYYNDSWTKYQYNVNTILGVIHYEGSFVSSDQYKQLWLVNELEILRPDNSFRPLTLSLTSGSLALGTEAIWMT